MNDLFSREDAARLLGCAVTATARINSRGEQSGRASYVVEGETGRVVEAKEDLSRQGGYCLTVRWDRDKVSATMGLAVPKLSRITPGLIADGALVVADEERRPTLRLLGQLGPQAVVPMRRATPPDPDQTATSEAD